VKKRLLILLSIFIAGLHCAPIVCRGIVYMYCNYVDAYCANTQPSQGYYIHEIRDGLRRLGYTPIVINRLDGLNNFDRLVFCCSVGAGIGNSIKNYPREKIIAFLWEPPTVCPDNYTDNFYDLFSKLYTWDDGLVDGINRFHFYYPVFRPMVDNQEPFDARKLCVLMNANKDSGHPHSLYSERRNVIYFFEHNHSDDFDLYGPGWQSFGLKNYKGIVESKLDYIKRYRFCFAYENMQQVKGYITEKIFDAFAAGCVPIYWGAENITDYIPKGCFIDRRDFHGNEELYQFLKNMKEEKYRGYIRNIKCFLESPQALIFSTEYHVDIVLEAIEPNYDKTVALTERCRDVLNRLYKYLGRNSS
jgi:alpha(1,3/1,4) fucosyltransferase